MTASDDTDSTGSRPGRWALALAALGLVVVVPRLLFLGADPPQDIHIHFITDEGWWSHNARVRALFGSWILDEHNPPLFLASLHTGLLFVVYEVLGVGLWQTRLPSAVAGILTCLVVGLVVRREASDRIAFWAVLLLGTSYFFLSHNRVAFTESLQALLVTGAVFGFLRARERPVLAAPAALALIAAILAKPTSAIGGVVIGVLALALVVDRGAATGERSARWRSAWVFAGAFVLAVAGIWLLLARPHVDLITLELARSLPRGIGESPIPGGARDLLLWFGNREQPAPAEQQLALGDGFAYERVLSGFFAQSWGLVAAVGAAAVLRLLGARREPLGWLESTCWIWLAAVLALLAAKSYQPDRYFLLLLPPCATIAALAWGGPPSRPGAALDPTRPARILQVLGSAVATGVVGALLAVYARGPLAPRLVEWTADWPLGDEPGIGLTTAIAAIWLAALVAGAAIVELLRRTLGGRRLAFHVPVLLLAIVGIDVARFAPHLASPHYTVRDASRSLGALFDRLPADRRVVVGDTADTLSLENDAFAFLIRDWAFQGMFMNLDGIERFAPSFALVTEWNGVSAAGKPAVDWNRYPLVHTLEAWPDRAGRPQLRILVHALDDAAEQAAGVAREGR